MTILRKKIYINKNKNMQCEEEMAMMSSIDFFFGRFIQNFVIKFRELSLLMERGKKCFSSFFNFSIMILLGI